MAAGLSKLRANEGDRRMSCKMMSPTLSGHYANQIEGQPTRGWKRTAALGALCLSALMLAGSPLAVRAQNAGASAQANDPSAKVDSFIRERQYRSRGAVIVPALVEFNGGSPQTNEMYLKALKATIYQRLPLVNSVAVRMPENKLAVLARQPFVKRVSEDVQMQKTDEFTVASSAADVAFSQMSATGQGVTIAVLDSGIKSRPDLNDPVTGNSRILANVSFVAGDTSTDDPCGHGTHAAGIAAGNGA